MGDQFKELEKRREVVERMEKQKEQDEHQITRLENRIAKIEKVNRKQRTHLLCSKAGYIEAIFPTIKDASKTDFIQFCDGLLQVPGVKQYAKNFKPKPIEEVIS